VLGVALHLEHHEVAKLEAARLLKTRKHVVRRAGQAEVDILRGACVLETELEDEATLEQDIVSEDLDEPRKEPIKDEELAPASEVDAVSETARSRCSSAVLNAAGVL